MTHPTNVVLTDAEINELCGWIAANTTMRAENDRKLARDVERAVIEKLATGDAVPVMRIYAEGNMRVVTEWLDGAKNLPDGDHNLYDATALAQARQPTQQEA